MKRLIWTLAVAASIAASATEPPTSNKEAATTVVTRPQGQQSPAASNPPAPISDGGRNGREEEQAVDSRWTMIFTGCSAAVGTLQLPAGEVVADREAPDACQRPICLDRFNQRPQLRVHELVALPDAGIAPQVY